MYSTTLRLDESLASFLQEEARAHEMSVNALLAELVRQAREARTRHRLAKDWAVYAQDPAAQDVSYALHAQAEVAAEPKAKSYRAKKRP